MVTEVAVLSGKRILLVEDEYLLTSDLGQFLAAFGVLVLGPAPTLENAMVLIDREQGQFDGALLDVHLRGKLVYPVADRLLKLGIPIVFTTADDELLRGHAYITLPRCSKPVDKRALIGTLTDTLTGGRRL